MSVGKQFSRTLIIAFLFAVTLAFSITAEAQCTLAATQWVNTNSPLGDNWTTQAVSSSELCGPVRAVVDGTGGTHVYAENGSGHLIEFFQSVLGSNWQRFDISSSTLTNINGIPNPLHLANTSADIQVFALSPTGHLLSFVTTNNTHIYQVFDLNVQSGSSASLTGMPAPIQFGSTVHVYVAASTLLQDFVKPVNGQWQDVNLSTIYGLSGFAPSPYAYGGNSIQVAAVAPSTGHVLSFIELVNSDGTISSFPFAGDLTTMAGGTADKASLPAPILVGIPENNVSIWLDDTRGHLVEYFKAPTANWVEKDFASFEPAAVLNDGFIEVFTVH